MGALTMWPLAMALGAVFGARLGAMPGPGLGPLLALLALFTRLARLMLLRPRPGFAMLARLAAFTRLALLPRRSIPASGLAPRLVGAAATAATASTATAVRGLEGDGVHAR